MGKPYLGITLFTPLPFSPGLVLCVNLWPYKHIYPLFLLAGDCHRFYSIPIYFWLYLNLIKVILGLESYGCMW